MLWRLMRKAVRLEETMDDAYGNIVMNWGTTRALPSRVPGAMHSCKICESPKMTLVAGKK